MRTLILGWLSRLRLMGLQYPDSTNANGTPIPASLCAAVFNDAGNPEYPDLPSTTAEPWSCPYSAKAGDTTLLDITLSAYNEGPGYTDSCGICRPWYVAAVEGFVPSSSRARCPFRADVPRLDGEADLNESEGGLG